MTESLIPFHRPLIDEEEIDAVVECLRSGWLTTGQRTKEFEDKFAQYLGVPHAIAVNSCTAAMHLALAGLGIRPGDEVITTPYTFVATCEAIQYLGARPVFVDIDAKTMNLNASLLTDAFSERTRAVLPVHIAGHPADMPRISSFSQSHGLKVIDDAAHALEASMMDDRVAPGGNLSQQQEKPATNESQLAVGKIGTLGDASCFSFYATKNLTTGEGGMVTCHDAELAKRIRRLALHGLSKDAWKRYSAAGSWYYEVVEQGYKYNLTDIAAAIGLVQLKKIDSMWQRRADIVDRYNAAFSTMPELEIPTVKSGARHAWHLYLLRLNLEKLAIVRDEFFNQLRERGVCCSVHFIPLHLMPYYRRTYGFQRGDFPEAEKQFERVISLPLYPGLTDRHVEQIIASVKQIVKKNSHFVTSVYA